MAKNGTILTVDLMSDWWLHLSWFVEHTNHTQNLVGLIDKSASV